jgi:hypothetical protein
VIEVSKQARESRKSGRAIKNYSQTQMIKVSLKKKTGYILNNPPKANLNVNTKNLNKKTKASKVEVIATKILNSPITPVVPKIY